MSRFIVRFDDVSPGMNWDKFYLIKNVLQECKIPSLLGVIPLCMDESLKIYEDKIDFYEILRIFKADGDTIAQHGTYHLYVGRIKGILGINERTEFAGLDYFDQLRKLKIGKEKLLSEDLWQPYFMAPSHSFDLNTIRALNNLGFQAITDGYGLYPYSIEGIKLIPQLFSKPLHFGLGIYTICLHTNSLSKNEIDNLINFFRKNRGKFISFEEAVKVQPPLKYLPSIARVFTEYLLRTYRAFR